MTEPRDPILIIKVGSTLPSLRERRGDFEDWIREGMALEPEEVSVVDVTAGAALPDPASCPGAVVTGSHSMVTEKAEWSERTAQWLAAAQAAGVPILGICYGHQLLAHAVGGEVADNPEGPEYGTVEATLERPSQEDSLLRGLPIRLAVQASHSQSVIKLPKTAVHLAHTEKDPNHAFRIGERAWGIQFHPEFDADIMREYIAASRRLLEKSGQDPEAMHWAVQNTDISSAILQRFVRITVEAARAR
jgi:GMP synthase (glutamine-hydrolysing)